MPRRWIIGLTSGSSVDGIDAALVEIHGTGLHLEARLAHCLHQPYGGELRDLILRVSKPGAGEVRNLGLLHRLLGEAFAAGARQVADRASLSFHQVQCIGCGGHTIWHDPEGRFPSTLTAGMPAVVAERTGVTTLSEFRARDVAAGGQGVPLVALADHILFCDLEENRVLLHLGGLSRIVYLPATGRIQDIEGFEAGPCNLLLDGLIHLATNGRERFDPGGKHAVQGCCLEPILERWLSHPYLQRRPPKSVPRHTFGSDFISEALHHAKQAGASLHDLLCTATHFVARGTVESLERFVLRGRRPGRVLLSGGGTRNGLLLHLLQQLISGIPVEKTDRYGIPSEARKSVAIGVLAALTMDGVPANAPSATGAAGSRLLGSLTPGSAANWTSCVEWMAAQTAPAVHAEW